jgi:hypothetical protein
MSRKQSGKSNKMVVHRSHNRAVRPVQLHEATDGSIFNVALLDCAELQKAMSERLSPFGQRLFGGGRHANQCDTVDCLDDCTSSPGSLWRVTCQGSDAGHQYGSRHTYERCRNRRLARTYDARDKRAIGRCY